MSARNRERKEKQRAAFGTPPTPQQRGYVGGSMSQVQCRCGRTFPHEAARTEHWRTSVDPVCQPWSCPPARTTALPNPHLWFRGGGGKSNAVEEFMRYYQIDVIGVDPLVSAGAGKQIDMSPKLSPEEIRDAQHRAMMNDVSDLIRHVKDLRRCEQEQRDLIFHLREKQAEAEKEIEALKATLTPRKAAEVRGRIDWTTAPDDEDCLTSTERIPKGRTIF